MATLEQIGSVGDLVETLQANDAAVAGAMWYRGHADEAWPLMPGLLRLDVDVSETTLLNRFRQSAAMLADTSPHNSFDWTFLMQHYGVPTRLLDWSESPLVALYFAVEDYERRPNVNSALWCLHPTSLNKNANIVDKVEGNYIPSFDDEELKSYTIESVRQNTRVELFPVATIATRNNPRIQAQLGTFTIHHNKKVPIEQVGDKTHVKKYTIPDEKREKILRELKLIGINRLSMFPELSSVGSVLKEMLL